MILWLLLAAGGPCSERGTAIVVRTGEHKLYVCESGAAVAEHQVAIGQGGISGPKEYSDKTPLGVWSFSAPRPSKKYGTFISFRGLYGLHGPPRSTKNLGATNVSVDWTLGCIAVQSDPVMDSLTGWIREHPRAKLIVET